jgi:hypothetical protein
VRCDELLLLAHRAQEAERVHAEADQSQQRQDQQASGRDGRQPYALAQPRRRQHEERQHHAGGDLDPDARDERGGARPQSRAGAGRECQR